MFQNDKYTFMLFYSNYNQESQRTRIAINEILKNNYATHKLNLMEVNYDLEKPLCEQYGVNGIPTLLVFINQKIAVRYFGEITSQDFEAIVESVLTQTH